MQEQDKIRNRSEILLILLLFLLLYGKILQGTYINIYL